MTEERTYKYKDFTIIVEDGLYASYRIDHPKMLVPIYGTKVYNTIAGVRNAAKRKIDKMLGV